MMIDMGLHNTKLLETWAARGRYSARDMDVSILGTLKTEEERTAFLRGATEENVAAFKSLMLWENEADIPEWDPEIKNQLLPQVVYFSAADVENPGQRGCIIVAPGGGFNIEADMTEGWPIINRLVHAGFNCALVVYRLRPYRTGTALLDTQRAVRFLRLHAAELGFNPDRIGMIGGSAGGRLTGLTGVHYDAGNPDAADPVERMSSKLQACIVMYGTRSDVAYPLAHAPYYSEEDLKRTDMPRSPYSLTNIEEPFFLSVEKWVTPDTPPFFMWQTCDEDDPRHLFTFAKALADARVRFEAHIYPFGCHGLGLADGIGQPPKRRRDEHVMHWMEQAIEWLNIYEFNGGNNG